MCAFAVQVIEAIEVEKKTIHVWRGDRRTDPVAPPLQGLDLEDLPKQLTRAYFTIAADALARKRRKWALEPELAGVTERLESLAPTQEAFAKDQFYIKSVDADAVPAMQKIDALFAQGDGPSN